MSALSFLGRPIDPWDPLSFFLERKLSSRLGIYSWAKAG
jgi:hypothetical protein